jgi:site-specific recombinase XerD
MYYSGSRPLQEDEIEKMLATCTGKYAARDRLLIKFGCYTGFRISEILAVNLGDVFHGSKPLCQVVIAKGFVKGKARARTMPLHANVRQAIEQLVAERVGYKATDPLFTCQRTTKRLSRRQATAIVVRMALVAGIPLNRIGTHSLRKAFAIRMYNNPLIRGDMARMAHLLGHQNFSNTLKYLEFAGELERAVLMA